MSYRKCFKLLPYKSDLVQNGNRKFCYCYNGGKYYRSWIGLAVLALFAPLSPKATKSISVENREKAKNYLSAVGISLPMTFAFYMVSLVLAYSWFSAPSSVQALSEILLEIFFSVSNAMFLSSGLFVSFLIYLRMQGELD